MDKQNDISGNGNVFKHESTEIRCQQAAREAFENCCRDAGFPDADLFYYADTNSYCDNDVSERWEGYQDAHSSLMPALVEARDDLSYLLRIVDEKQEAFRDEWATLARINLVIGDKK